MIQQIPRKNKIHILRLQRSLLQSYVDGFILQMAFRLFPAFIPKRRILMAYVELAPQRPFGFLLPSHGSPGKKAGPIFKMKRIFPDSLYHQSPPFYA